MSRRPASIWVTPKRLDGRLDARAFKPWVVAGTDACRNFAGESFFLGDSKAISFLSRGVGGAKPDIGAVCVYKAKEVTGCGLRTPEVYLRKLEDCPPKKRLEPRDVLLTSSGIGTIGRADVHTVSCDTREHATADNHVTIIRVQEEQVDAGYLAAFLNSKYGKAWSEWGTTGSTRLLELAPSLVKRFTVPKPDRLVQRHIGTRVELAERCLSVAAGHWSEATECLASGMGTSLHATTFDVESAAKISADGYKVASVRPVVVRVGRRRLESQIGAQFYHPRRAKALLVIEESGLKTKRLADVSTRFANRVSSEDMRRLGLAYVGLARIEPETGFINNLEEEPIGVCARFEANDILFSKLRPYLNKVSICPEYFAKAAGSTELVTYRPNDGIDPYYLFFVLKTRLVLNQVTDITSGLTHPRVAPELIDEVRIPLVSDTQRTQIANSARSSLRLLRRAYALFDDAKSEVEALIEGTLNVKDIVNGKLKPPIEAEVIGK